MTFVTRKTSARAGMGTDVVQSLSKVSPNEERKLV